MKSAFDNNLYGSPPSEQKSLQNTEDRNAILGDIMEVFSMIMHKGYKHEPTALCYEESEDDGIAVRFRHSSTLDMEDHDEAIKERKPFYEDMRRFLAELDGLDTRLDIYPETLTFHAENMVAIVDALASYFKQEGCALKISDTAKPDMSDRAALADFGASLIKNNREAYEYYFDSIPSQGFTSMEHLNATIAARALCDIPVSLETIRRKIVGTQPEMLRPFTSGERRLMLEDSFNTCAEWCHESASVPSVETSSLFLERERHLQLASTVHALLISHYHLAKEITRGYVTTFIGQVDNGMYEMRFACEVMPEGKVFGGYYAKFHAFAEDLRKADESLCGVALPPVQDKRLLTIRYFPDDLFKVLVNMVSEQHPDNLDAQAHLRAAAQVSERIELNIPVNAMN